MAVYDHEEQEQLAKLKAWWADYGNYVTSVLVAVAVASVAWQGWQWYQSRQAGEAAQFFSAVQRAVETNSPHQAREAAGQLIGQYSGSVYADLGALLASSVQRDAEERRNARAHLNWVVDKGNDPALRDLARLRLASLLFDDGELDEALKLLAVQPAPALVPRYADLLGDIRVAQGDLAAAQEAYRSSITAGTETHNTTLRELVNIKLQAIGG